MATSLNFLLLISLSLAALIISASIVDAGSDSSLNWFPTKPRCDGSIADCMGNDDEFSMDSEINRRVLATTTSYISYSALKQGSTPCSYQGVSYYNCQPSAEANPYTRSCSAITKCRS